MPLTDKFNQSHRTDFGYIAEHHVLEALSAHGRIDRERCWHFDFLFMGNVHVEVKSAQLGIFRTGFGVRRVNHGWTIYRDRHSKLLQEPHGFYALVLMLGPEVLCVRFLPASDATGNLCNSMDSTMKPRIRLGALYNALKPCEFIQLCAKYAKPL
jgi:hypothetical protein